MCTDILGRTVPPVPPVHLSSYVTLDFAEPDHHHMELLTRPAGHIVILVTGATGTSAAPCSPSSSPPACRSAMTRRPAHLCGPPGAEVVGGDAEDPESLDTAFAGVDAAFLMSAQPVGSAPAPTHDLALVDAARRAGLHWAPMLRRSDTVHLPFAHPGGAVVRPRTMCWPERRWLGTDRATARRGSLRAYRGWLWAGTLPPSPLQTPGP